MPTKLIVTGLCDEIRDNELYDLFDAYGPIIDVGVEIDRLTSRPTGTGYVVYDEALCAARARLCMDGAEINGRVLCVRPSFGVLEVEDGAPAVPLNDAPLGPPTRNLRSRVH
jgi:RNA recognition motif-containing protein